MIIGTAGHIDHGKTALVKALTGVDTDRLPEEKRRGITIDLGFAPLSLEGIGTVGMIDVPGHEDFVRSMLVGASGIDVALLVIAADEGVMPQTREHLLILSLLEIPQLVVALTKSDLVEGDWLALVHSEAQALLADTRWPLAPIVPCSARTKSGIDDLRSALAQAAARPESRPADDLFRLPVDRVFTVRGTGTVVTGTVWSGSIEREADVRLLPGGAHARVRRIEQHGQTVASAAAGVRAALALGGIDVTQVGRGSVIVADRSWRATSLFEAVVTLDAQAPGELKPRTRVRLHSGATEVGARVTVLNGAVLRPGAWAVARVAPDSPIPLRGGDRFVLRLPAPVGTIGGGTVIDPYARRRSINPPENGQLAALSVSAAKRLEWILEGEGVHGVPITEIPIRSGLTPAETHTTVLGQGGRVGANNLFAAAAVESTMAQVRMIIAEYEIRSPLSPGVSTQTLRGGLRAHDELAGISIRGLESLGEIETDGPLIRRKGWEPAPSVLDIKESNALAHDICAAEREPPSVGELVSRHGSSVPALLRYLEREGRIVQVEADRYYDRSTLAEMIAMLGELVPGQVYLPAQLRDVLGLSRKYLIPFLEFCDRKGVTERRGEGRVLRESAAVVLDTPQPQS